MDHNAAVSVNVSPVSKDCCEIIGTSENLTLKAPITTAAEDFHIFFIVFQRK